VPIQQQHDRAFDVEAVTDKFFEEYKRVFDRVKGQISGIANPEAKRLFAQKLFNRLMFIAFIEKKGWLEFGGRTDYLDALWEDYQNTDRSDKANFYHERLSLLFFSGLNNPQEQDIASINGGGFIKKMIGKVPFLNGGLFEQDQDERNEKISVPDGAIELIFDDLFDKFNFTVSESTPLDEEVAVDPEMLGKVFEELCNSRHDSGSYYTPKPIVSFMCREALKGYLKNKYFESSQSPEDDAIAKFVDDRDASQLSDPEAVLKALKEVTVCDPACGSGAYLLGMLHELLELRECLFKSNNIGTGTVYDRKLEIIEHNLYGVDKELFAVNIARLRLWLSLAVDFAGDKPKPLPNLKYKLEVGDSLLAPMTMAQQSAREVLIPRYRELKAKYINTHYGSQKTVLVEEIEKIKSNIATLTHGNNNSTTGFDWAVEFAEVIADGGFDIQVANPPYIRQEKIVDFKPQLKKVFPAIYNGTSDLYCYFYARSLQLLKPGGMLAFISSNKWFRAGYGEKLRGHISDTCQVSSITDFGELPVFKSAATFPMIFICQSNQSDDRESQVKFTQVKSLEYPYPNVKEIIDRDGSILPSNAIAGGNWLLTDNYTANYIKQMEMRGIPLGEYVNGQIYYGVKTGFNKAFVIDSMTRDQLIFEDPASEEIIKPLAVGDDVRKWRTKDKGKWLIVTKIGIDIAKYPAIFNHLQKWQSQLEKRCDQGNHWWELRACAYYSAFDQPKIIYPDIAKESRFTFDNNGKYLGNTSYFIPVNNLYLLGVLNSSYVWNFCKENCSVMGDAAKNGRLRLFRDFMKIIPIPHVSEIEQKQISKLVQKCLDAKGVGCEKWEREIDILVGRLYGFEDNHELN
jgi:type I restriction-modification system DNA methylase subunit